MIIVQGVQTQYDILWSPRWWTKIDLQVLKKVAVHSGGLDIWVLSIYFQKSNIGWPPQPPTEKGAKFQPDILWFYQQFFFLKHQNKLIFVIKLLNPRTWLTLKNSLVIFLASDTYAASLTLAASETSMASMTSKALFPQKTSWFWWFHPHWHQNDQYWSLFGDWIIKNPNFYWYLAIFLSEAVEASQCYFFRNKLIKLKCPNLLNVLLFFFKLWDQF